MNRMFSLLLNIHPMLGQICLFRAFQSSRYLRVWRMYNWQQNCSCCTCSSSPIRLQSGSQLASWTFIQEFFCILFVSFMGEIRILANSSESNRKEKGAFCGNGEKKLISEEEGTTECISPLFFLFYPHFETQ